MPARINKIRHDENTRAKIKAAELINRFQRHFFGECDLTPTQVKVGQILLDRVLPVLQSVEITAEITTTKVIRTPAPATSVDTWQKQYSDAPKSKDLN